jgi:hypothetical protein
MVSCPEGRLAQVRSTEAWAIFLQVDVVISPTKTAGIGTKSFSYPLTMGDINLVQLLQITRPKVMSYAELAVLIMHTHWTWHSHVKGPLVGSHWQQTGACHQQLCDVLQTAEPGSQLAKAICSANCD